MTNNLTIDAVIPPAGKTVNITEFDLNWPGSIKGSTHELVITEQYIYVTGQNMHQVAKVDYNGNMVEYFEMPKGSGPHGILIDKKKCLWVSLEFQGKVVRLNNAGYIVEEIDVKMYATGAATPVNTAPHGIGLDADGETIWFTGKRTSTVGRINVDRSVEHFQLSTLGALPIFLSASSNGGIWGTELFGSSILNITVDNIVREFTIPTLNSRPIAVIPDPSGKFMWFTEEAGVKIGKIDMDGQIIEYSVPALQKDDKLASLVFDKENNLWVQVYSGSCDVGQIGIDYIIRFDKSIRDSTCSDLSGVAFTIYYIPSKMSMMHRIKMDYHGDLWFTEMMTDKLGKVGFAG